MWISERGGSSFDEGPDRGKGPVDDGMDQELVLDLDQVVGALAEEADLLPVVLSAGR